MPLRRLAQRRIRRANGSNSAVVRAGDDLWVWDFNYIGQVGSGTEENNRNTPFKVPGLEDVVAISAASR